jgi:hypothetical protein
MRLQRVAPKLGSPSSTAFLMIHEAVLDIANKIMEVKEEKNERAQKENKKRKRTEDLQGDIEDS